MSKLIIKKDIITWCICLLLLSSCGARKVAIVKEDTKITIDSTAIVKTDIVATTNNNIIIDTQTQEIEVTPIDTCKEVVINNAVYKNARIRIKNIKTKQIDTTIKKVAKTSLKEVKKAIVKQTQVKKKEIERKEGKNYLWFLAIVLIIYFLWRFKWDILFWIKEKLKI